MTTYPTRLAHLLSYSFLAELLAPSYASANSRDAADVYDEVKTGLDKAHLQGALCDAVWAVMRKSHPEADEATLARYRESIRRRKNGAPRAAARSPAGSGRAREC